MSKLVPSFREEVPAEVAELVAEAIINTDDIAKARAYLLEQRAQHPYRGRFWLLFDSAALLIENAILETRRRSGEAPRLTDDDEVDDAGSRY